MNGMIMPGAQQPCHHSSDICSALTREERISHPRGREGGREGREGGTAVRGHTNSYKRAKGFGSINIYKSAMISTMLAGTRTPI